MRKEISFQDDGWDDYLHWQVEDCKILKKINTLLKDINRTPFSGLGKPEPLKHDWQGYWSRRINDEHRLVYKVDDNKIIVAQCKGHYQD